jgi:hypothetical protein
MPQINYHKYSKSECSVSICSEFEAIRDHALRVPETTEEMMELIAFVERARTVGILDLALRIQVKQTNKQTKNKTQKPRNYHEL